MPYLDLENFVIRDDTATGTSFTVPTPLHAVGDMLVVCANADGTNIPSLPTSTGGGTWVDVQNAANAALNAARVSYLIATSTAETCTFTIAASNDCVAWIGVVKSNGGTLTADVSAERTVSDLAMPFNGVAATPTVVNTLALHFLVSDGGIAPIAYPPRVNVANFDDAGVSIGVAYSYQKTTAAISAGTWFGRTDDDTLAFILVIKDDGTEDRVNAYLDASTVATYWTPLTGGNILSDTWDAASPLSLAALGGRDLTQVWSFNGAYTDETADAASITSGDVTITNAIGSIWYFGYDYTFENITVLVSTAQNGGAIVWEYWNGSAWTALTASGVLTAVGWFRVGWTIPANWASTAVNGVTKFYVRMRVTTAFTVAPALGSALGGGGPTTFDAAAASADAGLCPYMDALNLTPATGGTLTGSEILNSGTRNMSSGILVVHHRASQGRDYAVDPARGEQAYPVTTLKSVHGMLVGLADASGNYEAYTIHSKGSKSNSNYDYNVAAMAINNGAQPALKHGTLSKAAVKSVFFLVQPQYGAFQGNVAAMLSVTNLVIAGGGASGLNPISFDELCLCCNMGTGVTLLMKQIGSFATCYAPLQFGGGDDCNIDCTGSTFVWPHAFDGQKYHDYNGNADVLGIVFYGKTTDDHFVFDAAVFNASGQSAKFEFHASHSASATLSFVGATIIGMNVTLRSTVTLAGVTFRDCTSFVQNNAALSDCTFDGTLVVSDNPADVSDGVFIADDPKHGMEITAAGTYSFVGNTFSGFGPNEFGFHTTTDVNAATDVVTEVAHGFVTGDEVMYRKQGGSAAIGLTDATLYYVRAVTVDTLAFFATAADAVADTSRIALTSTGSDTHFIASTRAAVYNNSGGAVTLNVSGGGSVPSIRNGAGASTTVNNTKSLTLTGLVAGSEVLLFRVSDGALLDSVSSSGATFSHSYNYVSDVAVYWIIQKTDYQWLRLNDTLSSSGGSRPAGQRLDRDYANP